MNEQKLIYEVQNLSFSYGEHQVLQEMSFSLQKGKITTLIGANGCGKSTLFQLLTRNLKPDQGEICLYGENLRNMKLKDLAKKAAIVHQYHTAPADLSVEKLIGYGRIPHRRTGSFKMSEKDVERVEWAMEKNIETVRSQSCLGDKGSGCGLRWHSHRIQSFCF